MTQALPELRKREKFWGRITVVGLILLIAAPLIGVLSSLIGMRGAFAALGTSSADVGALANHISQVLVSTATGLIIGGLGGIPLLIVGLVKGGTCRKARRELTGL